MKKVLTLCLAIMMVVAMAVPAFAGPGSFISSPSGNKAPELIEFTCDGCSADVVVTAYADRYTLDDATRAKLEAAYATIVGTTDATTLNADLAKLAKEMNIDASKLAVSDLFDISYVNCPNHEGHGAFNITIKSEMLKGFVGLVHFNGESWDLVKDAKVVNGNLVFTIADLSPFAIVVDTSADAPITGDSSNIGFYVAAMALSASALFVVVLKLKKRAIN